MACRRAGSPGSWPATGTRARPRSSRGRGDRSAHRERRPPTTVELIVESAAAPRRCGRRRRRRRRSAGTSRTITACQCRPRRSAGYLHRAGLVTPQPHKRPRSSYVRFAGRAAQRDLAGRLHPLPPRRAAPTSRSSCWLDDHARYALRLTAHHRVTGPIVLNEFRAAVAQHGVPASTLTDNGMVFTTRFSGGKGGRNGFEAELVRLGMHQKNSGPTTRPPAGRSNGSTRPSSAGSPPRPDQPDDRASCRHCSTSSSTTTTTNGPTDPYAERCTPADAYHRRPKATAGDRGDTHDRVRHDLVDKSGTHHPARQRPHAPHRPRRRTPRHPRRSCSSTTSTSASSTPPPANSSARSPSTRPATTSPSAAHPDPNPRTTEIRVQGVSDVSRHHRVGLAGFEPTTP